MEQKALNKQDISEIKNSIVILALISLFSMLISCIVFFVRWDGRYLELKLPDIFHLFSIVFRLAPCILFVIYILKFYSRLKATIIVPIIFAVIAINSLYFIMLGTNAWGLITYLLHIIAFVLATYNALKGFSKRWMLIIAITIGIGFEILSLRGFFTELVWYLEGAFYINIIADFMRIIGYLTLYISLLLFGLNNRIPTILHAPIIKLNKDNNMQSMEIALRRLKDEVDFGKITEDEAKARKAEIISKFKSITE